MSFKQAKPYYCGPASLVALELSLFPRPPHSQDEWGVMAGTTTGGTSIAGLKRCIKKMGFQFKIVRKTSTPWHGSAIIYDASRDHWMTVRVCGIDIGVWIMDPETGKVSWSPWIEFQQRFMNSAKNSYALVVLSST